MRFVWSAAALAVVGLWAQAAGADETHYENFRFGQTAIGFGGAVTGFLAEPEAAFYNPGGLGFLERSKFSGAINFLGRDRRIIRRWVSLNDGFSPEKDGRSQDVLTLPGSSVVAKSLFGGRHIVAFSTFLYSETRDKFSGQLPLNEDDELLRIGFTENLEDRMVFIGPSYAARISDRLSIGASVFYARRTFSVFDQFTERILDPEFPADAVGYFEVQEQLQTTDGGLLARVGAMYRIDDHWSVGAVIATPAIHLHGKARYNYRIIDANPSDEEGDEDADLERFFELNGRRAARTQYPWMIGLGASWANPGQWRLATSVNIHMPLNYARVDLDSEEIADDEFASFVADVERELTINASLGGELYLSKRWPLRVGLFTNRASSPAITSSRSPVPRLPHVDLYGASVSIGYEQDGSSINFGFEVQAGAGHETSLDASFTDAEPFLRRRREQYRGVFFVSGALAFVSGKAGELIEIDEDKPNKTE